MNPMAAIVGGGVFGSWDAVNAGTPGVFHDTINPKTGCTMTRPNGSGEGLSALRKSINPATAAGQLADPPEPGCVDVGRSSSGPGGNQNNAGLLVYIPFALDAVATATGGTTNIAQADGFTLAQLQGLYQCTPQTVGGVTYDPNSPPAGGNQGINLYIPQPGSGTRNFWATTMGISSTSLPACVHDHSVVTAALVEEHDGTVYQGDPNGFGPFSIAQWISQNNGHNDRRHGAVLHNINSVSPFSGSSLNTAYPVTREVFNIVEFARVTPGDPKFDQGLFNIFVTPAGGPNSTICSQSLTIRSYGFATLSASTPHTCGQVATSLRAFLTI
jgi:phosphate transport system substrate-binding protein